MATTKSSELARTLSILRQENHFISRLTVRQLVGFGRFPHSKGRLSAEDEAKSMGDEYVSVEHLFLALLKQPGREMKELFKTYGITRERFLQALSTVRGQFRG